ncbi:hypothetical protein [Streptomyces sp. NPDC058206]|uniref:hypothetical protein n=1 Tax=Streptomyces sp. NPDC058206 TaxID=3346382 RepID=UPI0036E48F3B
MTISNVKVSLTGEVDLGLRRQPQVVVEAAFEAIRRLETNPQHPSLGCGEFARMGGVFVFRLNAEYRGLFVALAPDRLVIVAVEHRRNYGRLLEVAREWSNTPRLEGLDDYDVAVAEQAVAVLRTPTRLAARATTWASKLAGSRRAHLHDEWAAVLAGDPEMNAALRPGQQMMLAVGFVFAAIRLRARDTARPLWRPVDWLLREPSRTNAFIAAAVGGQAILIVGDGGLTALLTEVWEPCGIAGASLFALMRWLRRVRGIELAASNRERADE